MNARTPTTHVTLRQNNVSILRNLSNVYVNQATVKGAIYVNQSVTRAAFMANAQAQTNASVSLVGWAITAPCNASATTIVNARVKRTPNHAPNVCITRRASSVKNASRYLLEIRGMGVSVNRALNIATIILRSASIPKRTDHILSKTLVRIL